MKRNTGLWLFFIISVIGATQLIDFGYMTYVVVFNVVAAAMTWLVIDPLNEVLNKNKLTTVQLIVLIPVILVLLNIPFWILDSMFHVG